MNKDMLENFTMWGDRSSRDTAHLMDLVAAGVIDQTIGHGTVTLRPARLEEIVSRIAHRTQDPDGGWVVTLMPEAGSDLAQHGTAEQAMQWALEVSTDSDPMNIIAFLNNWREGAAREEWPEYYDWLASVDN